MSVSLGVTNVSDLLKLRARAAEGRIAPVDGDRRATWAQLDEDVDHPASASSGWVSSPVTASGWRW